MRKFISNLILVAVLFSNMFIASAYNNEIYVSKNGSDAADGTAVSPFETIEKAVEYAKKNGGNTVINVEEGNYTVESIYLEFNNSNITFKGNGEVNITDSKKIPVSDFNIVTNPEILKRLRKETWGKVYELSLKSYGDNISNLQFFLNGEKLNVSRYPNRTDSVNSEIKNDVKFNYLSASNPSDIVDSAGNMVYDKTFVCDDSRVSYWEDWDDAYIVGSTVAAYDWRKLKIESVSGNEIEVDKTIRDAAEWYICNLIDEIDVPGEFAVDSKNKMLYCYLPENYDSMVAEICTDNSNEPVIKILGADNITVDNINFSKMNRKSIVTSNADDITIKNCSFDYINANWALDLNGTDILVDKNSAYGLSGGFVTFSGGEIATLTPGNIVISNNVVSNCRKEDSNIYIIGCGTNSPESVSNSIGNKILNNVVFNCGGSNAISPTGNNIEVKNNEVFNVSRHIHDGGAIYTGKSNTKYGIEIKNNYVHHLNKNLSYVGIYSDDGQGGIDISNNILYDMQRGMIIGLGMNCKINDNLFIDMDKDAIGAGSRMTLPYSVFWGKDKAIEGTDGKYILNKNGERVLTLYGETKTMLEKYGDVFAAAYPDLAASLDRVPFFAPYNSETKGNVLFNKIVNDDVKDVISQGGYRHVYYSSPSHERFVYGEKEYMESIGMNIPKNGAYIDEIAVYSPGGMSDNKAIVYEESDFANYSNQDFTLTNTSKIPANSNIENINMSSIGVSDISVFENDKSLDFYPTYSEGKLKIYFDKVRDASAYTVELSQNGNQISKETVYDNNFDTAYEYKINMTGTYTITVTASNLARQNLGSLSKTKNFTVTDSIDTSALGYAISLAEKEIKKVNDGTYSYNDETVITELNDSLDYAKNIYENPTNEAEIEDTADLIIEKLLSMQSVRIVNNPTLVSSSLSDTTTFITVEAEDFPANSPVNIVVTNPKYDINDISGENEKETLRYTDLKYSTYDGKVNFYFDTSINGVDMPDYYKVYLTGANGERLESTYYYGTIETSAATLKIGEDVVSKNDLINYRNKTVTVLLDVNNRTTRDIPSTVYCGIYNGNRLIGIGGVESNTLIKNKVNTLSFDIEIPDNFEVDSTIEIMVLDKELLLKPLTVKKVLTKID